MSSVFRVLTMLFVLFPGVAHAAGFTDIGNDIEATPRGGVELHGDFRARGELLYNLDLDRGLTPSGEPLYPIPVADRTSQTLTHADFRLRTDLAAYSPIGSAAVKARIDVLDNLAAGSTPDGPPQAVVTQRPVDVLSIRRAYAEVLTPFGLIAAGRMGAHWGTGMLTNSGDCLDCDTGDAADRLAFITPMVGHVWALAYDLGFVGPLASRPGENRTIDLDPSDDVRGISFALLRYRTPRAKNRRRVADVATLDYGVVVSHRWQRNDIPASYLPTAEPVPIDENQVVERGLRAWLFDGYVDFVFPHLLLRAEAAYLTGVIDEPSVIPGVRYETPLTSDQWGGVLKTRVGAATWPVHFGLDGGLASGDAAYGFGAFPRTLEDPPQQGDLDGPQANPPFDNTVNNFRFHPDYHVDRILFREIIGTVTDAIYLRPHVDWHTGEPATGQLEIELAAVASWAMQPTSTPGGSEPLGVEIDPTIRYLHGPFVAKFGYGLFLPGAAFANPAAGLEAGPAQVARLQLNVGF
jgi:uncharacterized protein (TIGR04551 family)